MFQDNLSAQFLEINDKFLSSKKTKHIKAKFFFVKDKVDSREMKIIDCPTDVMWADIMRKPIQGKAYRIMRAKLMNCEIDYKEGKVNLPN